MILKLDAIGVANFKNRSVLDLDFHDRHVFALIDTLAGRCAVLLDLKREGAAVGNDHVMDPLKTHELAALVGEIDIQTSGITVELLRYLLEHMVEECLLGFFFASTRGRDHVRIGGDVAVGADEEPGPKSDCRTLYV